MESSCPHLGADLSHAEIEDWDNESIVAGTSTSPSLSYLEQISVSLVCPWHRYDFDLRTGKSETGLHACTYTVKVINSDSTCTPQIWVEAPGEGDWDVVEIRPVSEGGIASEDIYLLCT